jgi:hypothetical protein
MAARWLVDVKMWVDHKGGAEPSQQEFQEAIATMLRRADALDIVVDTDEGMQDARVVFDGLELTSRRID